MDPIGMHNLLATFNAARTALDAGLPPPSSAAAKTSGADFGQLLKASIDHVDAAQGSANTLMQKFQLGDPKVSLEETMVALQKASLEFQEVVQVRNKVVAAYHDIMTMQV